MDKLSKLLHKNKKHKLKERYKASHETHDQAELFKIEREKRLIMRSGVTFFMMLIVFFWVINVKNLFKNTEAQNFNNLPSAEWQDIEDEFSETMEEIKSRLSELKPEVNLNEANSTTSPSQAQQLPADDNELNQDKIEELKDKLEEQRN